MLAGLPSNGVISFSWMRSLWRVTSETSGNEGLTNREIILAEKDPNYQSIIADPNDIRNYLN